MNKLMMVMAVVFSTNAFSMDAVNCVILKDGIKVDEISMFDILNIDSSEPTATLDGNLMDYTKDSKLTQMSFSNECDNSFEFEFKTADIKKAKKGTSATLEGKVVASIAQDESDLIINGTVLCEIKK